MDKRALMCIAASMACGGCAGSMQGFDNQQPIPLEAILNQIKCEISIGIVEYGENIRIRGWKIVGKLTTDIVSSRQVTAGVGGSGGPAILPLSPTASLGFNLSGSYQSSNTTKAIIAFVVESSARDTSICDANARAGLGNVVGLGIRDWLAALERSARGSPRIAVTGLDYSLIFGVVRSGEAGAQINVVPIKATASAVASRSDTQTLLLTLSPPPAAVAAAARQAVRGSGPARVGATPGQQGGGVTFYSMPPPPAATMRLQNLEAERLYIPEQRR